MEKNTPFTIATEQYLGTNLRNVQNLEFLNLELFPLGHGSFSIYQEIKAPFFKTSAIKCYFCNKIWWPSNTCDIPCLASSVIFMVHWNGSLYNGYLWQRNLQLQSSSIEFILLPCAFPSLLFLNSMQTKEKWRGLFSQNGERSSGMYFLW